jgi:endonuclease/exonuclease/phosphatase family metal-dependent hydrolase
MLQSTSNLTILYSVNIFKVDINGNYITFVSAHLDAHGQQLHQVKEIVDNLPTQTPIFLAGDFNIGLNSNTYNSLTSLLSGFTDLFNGLRRERTHRNYDVVLDYMFATGEVLDLFSVGNQKRVDEDEISDHFGLSIDLCNK